MSITSSLTNSYCSVVWAGVGEERRVRGEGGGGGGGEGRRLFVAMPSHALLLRCIRGHDDSNNNNNITIIFSSAPFLIKSPTEIEGTLYVDLSFKLMFP